MTKGRLAAALLGLWLAWATEAAAQASFRKVFIVVLENATYGDAIAQPFLADLAARGALLTNFFAETHPSFPNYVALTAGSTFGITSDAPVTLDVAHVGDLLEAAGRTWKVYAEGYPGGCFLGTSAGTYVRKHVPFLSFASVQADPARCARIVDATALADDVDAGTLADYSLYVPNLNNDGHDTSVAFADAWLAQTFGPRLTDPRFLDDLLFVVTFDEGPANKPNQVYTALYGLGVIRGATSAVLHDHVSLLRTIEDAFGLGTLGQADAAATAVAGVWRPLVEFGDVPPGHPFRPWVDVLAAERVTGGCDTSPPRFCPDATVSRAQMAVFLLRGIHGADYAPADATGTVFDDVPTTHPLAPWIEALAREGISGGCASSPPLFCPGTAVTRAQMAVLLVRAVHGAGYQPPDPTGVFADVPATNWAAPWVEELAREGVTGGCGSSPPQYCPRAEVTRGQMAVFVVRAFGLPR